MASKTKKAKPKIKAQTKTKAKPKGKAQTKTKAKPKGKAQTKTKAKPKGKAQTKTKAKPKANLKSRPKAKVKPKPSAKPKPQVKQKATARQKAEAKVGAKAKAGAAASTKMKAKSEVKTKKPATKVKASPAAEKSSKPSPEHTPKTGPPRTSRPPKEPMTHATAPTGHKTAAPRKGKTLSRDFLIELASAIREAVYSQVVAVKGREVVGNAVSGDATFQIDKTAEKALLSFLRSAKLPVAYYSEDSGYTTFTSGQPENLLVVDPIDGTRAAKSGFESCTVSVVSTRVIERPRMVDVDNACVMEILSPRTFYAERGKGARIYVDGQYRKPRLSKNVDLELLSWSMSVPARPAELIFPTAAKLIDLTSLKGGFFACNSTSYSLTRLLTNQLDACVDFANRYLRDIYDAVEDYFINAGRGAILGIAPYDFAGALLIAEEAGCTVTDAYGRGFEDVLLLDSSVANHHSMIAASNPELHEKLMSFFTTRIRQYERLLLRRAELNGS